MRGFNLVLFFAFLIVTSKENLCAAQLDTLNQIDKFGCKQGYWIFYGIDKPKSGYADSLKVEEGRYIDDRKEGIWIRYGKDGEIRIKGEYKNNRPTDAHSTYSRFDSRFSNCANDSLDSLIVRLGHSNMTGPSTSKNRTVFPSDLHANYLDSLCHLDSSYQSSKGMFCSHVLEIEIIRFSKNVMCVTVFNTCELKSVQAKIARECAKEIFGFE